MNIDADVARTLQEATDLHVLAISRSSLRLVRLAYEQDTLALTNDVIQDAFSFGARQDVLKFLVERKSMDCNQISHMMGKVFLDAIPLLQSTGDPQEACCALQRLNDLSQAFPDSLINTDPNKLCPVSICLGCTVFPIGLLDSMIRLVPKQEQRFTLRGDGNLPTDNAHFQRDRRTEFDDRCMAAISNILQKVTEIHCRWEHWTESTFTRFLASLFKPGTCSVKEVHLDIWPFQFDKPLEQLVHPPPKCTLRDISISFVGSDRQPDFSILTPLLQMNCFDGVEIYIAKPWKANPYICKTLCTLVEQGRLQSLDLIAQIESRDLFLPLLEAVNKSPSLCDLRLQNIQNPSAVTISQSTMMDILKSNTKLEVALISDDYLTSDTILEHSGTRMQAHVNKEWFLEGKKGNRNQRSMDYYTLLNICGRGRARDTKNTSLKDFVDLITLETVQESLDFLDIHEETAKQDFITNVQYGLLREAPTIWTPKCEKREIVVEDTRQSKRKRKNTNQSTRKSTRKRKTATDPDEVAS